MRPSLALAALAVAVVACGGNTREPASAGPVATAPAASSAVPAGDGGTAPAALLPRPARARALSAVGRKWRELAGRPRPEARAAMAAYLRSLPEFEAAGATEMGAWGRFRDGTLAILADDFSVAQRSAPTARADHRLRLAAAVPGGALPRQKKYLAYDTAGNGHTARATIARMLDKRGYAQASAGPATVQALYDDVRDVSVLYFNTHGGLGEARDANVKGDGHNKIYALMSESPVLEDGKPIRNDDDRAISALPSTSESVSDGKSFDALLAQNKLVFMSSEVLFVPPGREPDANTPGGYQWNYGVTHLLVGERWTFAQDAFAFLNACSSMTEKAAAIRAAVVRAGQGRVTLAGWLADVEPSFALEVAPYAFDRLLGYGEVNTTVALPSPRPRPFALSEVMSELQKNNKLTSPKLGATLAAAGDAILAPSIRAVEVDEREKNLVVHGSFGESPGSAGRVTIADTKDEADRGTSLGGCTWAPEKVTCPIDGKLAGWVRVWAFDHPSNPVALTRFQPTFTFTLVSQRPGGQLTQRLVVSPIFRADLGAHREHLADAPKPRDPFKVGPSAASTCRFDVDGRWRESGVEFRAQGSGERPVLASFSGASSGPAGGLASRVPPEVLARLSPQQRALLGSVDPTNMVKTPNSCVIGGTLTPKAHLRLALSATLPAAYNVNGQPAALGFDVVMLARKGADAASSLAVEIPLERASGGWRLKGDRRTQNLDGGTLSLEWRDAAGDYPPDDDVAQ